MNLVTGANGLLGMHLMLHLLKQGQSVRGLVRSNSNREIVKRVFQFYQAESLYNQIEWVNGDVLDVISLQAAMQGVEHVYHTAAVVSYHKSDRQAMYKVNVEGTANVVNSAMACGVKKLGHVSSIAALNRFKYNPVTEIGEWEDSDDNTHYGITKHLSEMEVWRAGQEGLDIVILNPGFIIGPGDFSRSSTSVFSKLDEGFSYYPPGGTGFIGAKDAAEALVKLMQSKISQERFIAVSESLSMKELFQGISEAINRPIPMKEAQPWMLQVARIAEWLKQIFTGKKALVTKETVKNASLRFYYSSAKLESAVGMSFTPIDQCIQEAGVFYLGQKNRFHANS
ncbi:MAG: NAD-dependent epimerase/dehydratase family protein [Flavobacteriales bacterium]